jgi:hypothetical protein
MGRETYRVEIPYGMQVSEDRQWLQENPAEVEVLLAILEGLVQDHRMSGIARDLNQRGYRQREGKEWRQISVFELLPRLIEFGPRLFSHEEWGERRKRLGAFA